MISTSQPFLGVLSQSSLVTQMVKSLPGNVGDPDSIPGLGRCPGEGNDYALQYSCLENSKDRGALGVYSPWGLKKSDMTEQVNNNKFS